MPAGITKITLVSANVIGDTPASTHRPTGQVWVNIDRLPAHIKKLPEYQILGWLHADPFWYFIISHEEGHIALNTTSEQLADEYASKKYFEKFGKLPSKSVGALKDVLPMNTPDQYMRVLYQMQRAAKHDCNNNAFGPACSMSNYLDSKLNPNNMDFYNGYVRFNGEEFSSYTNCGKYLLPKRRKACEATNKMEQDDNKAQLDQTLKLAAINTGAQNNILTALQAPTSSAPTPITLPGGSASPTAVIPQTGQVVPAGTPGSVDPVTGAPSVAPTPFYMNKMVWLAAGAALLLIVLLTGKKS